MGLFDALRAKVSPSFDPQKAIMTIVIATIKIDGSVTDEEVLQVRSMCVRSPIFSKNTKEEDEKLIGFAINIVDQLGVEAVHLAAKDLTPALRETAFAFAIEVVLADGMVGSKEESYIQSLAEILGINEDLAQKIIEVTLIRGRDI